MDAIARAKIAAILDGHRCMTIATLRPDGWPQATTVGYANEGLSIYFLCGPESQKATNIGRDDRVSLTIDEDPPQVMDIIGVSMAARATRVTDKAEAEHALNLLLARYPPQTDPRLSEITPRAEELAIFRLTPEVISLLDYSQGFGHTQLFACEPGGRLTPGSDTTHAAFR